MKDKRIPGNSNGNYIIDSNLPFIPEPNTYSLVGTGLGELGGWAKHGRRIVGRIGKGVALGSAVAGTYLSPLNVNEAKALDTNMVLRVSLSTEDGTPTNTLYIDPASSENYAYITQYIRGQPAINPAKVVVKVKSKYTDPDGLDTAWVIVGATSKAFTPSGVFNGFDPQTIYNGDDVMATNTYQTVFATDTNENGFDYGPNPANFVEIPGLQLLTIKLKVDAMRVTSGAIPNLGALVSLSGSTSWKDEANKERTPVIEFDPGEIVFIPEPTTYALMGVGLAALAGWRRVRGKKDDKSLAGRVNNHNNSFVHGNNQRAHFNRGGQRRT